MTFAVFKEMKKFVKDSLLCSDTQNMCIKK